MCMMQKVKAGQIDAGYRNAKWESGQATGMDAVEERLTFSV